MPKKDKLPRRPSRRALNTCGDWLRHSGPCAYCAAPLLRNSLQPYCVECLNHRVMCTFIVAKMDSEEFWSYGKWKQRFQQLMGFSFGALPPLLKLQLADHCCECGLKHGYNGNWWHVFRTDDLTPLWAALGLREIPQAAAG